MSVFKNTLLFKRITIVISLIIVSLILWNTFIFFKTFKNEERLKMEILAAAQKELATNTDLDASTELPLAILRNNFNIPMILVDENGAVADWQNLDSIKAKDPEYLKKQLNIMKRENNPIVIPFTPNKVQTIYYRNSDLLNKLSYYPLALILIMVLFIAVIYLFFNSNKIAEQNKLWTGMAKETAHQIGTPLSSLLGWVAILKAENISEKYVDEIEKDIHRLNTIANRFSKIGSLPELYPLDLVEVTKKAYDYLASRTSKHIHFSFEAPSTPITVELNEALYGWVIENLIKNAIDAMLGKGDLSVRIQTDQNKVKITVSDTGKGIPKQLFKQVFKPGFTTKKRGWGLGLSLSKRIVEDYHGGKLIVLSSEIQKGTRFQIQLNSLSS